MVPWSFEEDLNTDFLQVPYGYYQVDSVPAEPADGLRDDDVNLSFPAFLHEGGEAGRSVLVPEYPISLSTPQSKHIVITDLINGLKPKRLLFEMRGLRR